MRAAGETPWCSSRALVGAKFGRENSAGTSQRARPSFKPSTRRKRSENAKVPEHRHSSTTGVCFTLRVPEPRRSPEGYEEHQPLLGSLTSLSGDLFDAESAIAPGTYPIIGPR